MRWRHGPKRMRFRNGHYGKVMLFHTVNELRFSQFSCSFSHILLSCIIIRPLYLRNRRPSMTSYNMKHITIESISHCVGQLVSLFSVWLRLTSVHFYSFYALTQSDFGVFSLFLSFFSMSHLFPFLLGCCRRTVILNFAFSFTPTFFFDHMKSKLTWCSRICFTLDFTYYWFPTDTHMYTTEEAGCPLQNKFCAETIIGDIMWSEI